jgi:hypothetical protein
MRDSILWHMERHIRTEFGCDICPVRLEGRDFLQLFDEGDKPLVNRRNIEGNSLWENILSENEFFCYLWSG